MCILCKKQTRLSYYQCIDIKRRDGHAVKMATRCCSGLLLFLLLIGVLARYQYRQKPCLLSPHCIGCSFRFLDVSERGWRKINLRKMAAKNLTSTKTNTTLLCILLVSGDIQLNPGPGTKYPCTICYKPVKANQMALECDGCLKWTHCKCCSMSKHEYQEHQQEAALQWHCPRCIVESLPFHNCSILSSDTQSPDTDNNDPTILPPNSNPNSSIRFGHLNCRSLLSHVDDVIALMLNGKIDVLTLSETWLDETINDQEIIKYGTGIHIVRNDRNRRGGGVAILLSERMRFRPRLDISEGKIESIWIELFPRSKRAMNVCCAYRPPSQYDFYEHLLEESENILLEGHKGLTIMGDLNSDLLDSSLQQTKLLTQMMRQL